MPALPTKMTAVPPPARRFSFDSPGIRDGLKTLYPMSTICKVPSNDHFTWTKSNRRYSLSQEEDRGRRIQCVSVRAEGSSLLHGPDITNSWIASPLSTSCKEFSCHICYAFESESVENHKESLDLYMEKLHRQAEPVSTDAGSGISELDDQSSQLQAMNGLQSLESYAAILKEDVKSEEYLPSTSGRSALGMTEDTTAGYMKVAKHTKSNQQSRKSKSSFLYDEKESNNLYLISVLLSMNIAVFLFEIASPIKSSDSNLYSLPLIYGAKVNDLIMVGEWWRLITPMFLHAGLLHIAFNSWILLSFGPQVCKGYGCFTFFLIYILGGISGNFTSFLHTTEPTVGGSGPVFAVIGAWLIYQMQNKDVTVKEYFENMFRKAMIATAFSFVLGNFGPIDNWANFAAAISGITYGFSTLPVMQVNEDDASYSSLGNRFKEDIMFGRQRANTYRSFIIFTLFISALSFLLYLTESPPNMLELEEFVEMVDQ